MSRPWSEWAETPPATWRAKWRAAMVGRSAPQMPTLLSASLPTSLQGPIEQMRQHAPVSPMGHGFMWSARWKAVSMPHSSACSSISRAAGSMLLGAAAFAPSFFTSSIGQLLRPWPLRGGRRYAAVSVSASAATAAVSMRRSVDVGGAQYLRWSPDMIRSAGSVAVTRTPAVAHAGLSVGGVVAASPAPEG